MDTKPFYLVGAFLAAVLGALFYFSQGSLRDLSPPEHIAALAKWRALDIQNYDVRIQISCFCDWRPLLVKVRGGRPIDVQLESPEDGSGMGKPDLIRRTLTIEDAFASLARAYSIPADQIEVRYDPQYGYPVHAIVDQSKNAVDDEWNMKISLTQVLHGA